MGLLGEMDLQSGDSMGAEWLNKLHGRCLKFILSTGGYQEIR